MGAAVTPAAISAGLSCQAWLWRVPCRDAGAAQALQKGLQERPDAMQVSCGSGPCSFLPCSPPGQPDVTCHGLGESLPRSGQEGGSDLDPVGTKPLTQLQERQVQLCQQTAAQLRPGSAGCISSIQFSASKASTAGKVDQAWSWAAQPAGQDHGSLYGSRARACRTIWFDASRLDMSVRLTGGSWTVPWVPQRQVDEHHCDGAWWPVILEELRWLSGCL